MYMHIYIYTRTHIYRHFYHHFYPYGVKETRCFKFLCLQFISKILLQSSGISDTNGEIHDELFGFVSTSVYSRIHEYKVPYSQREITTAKVLRNQNQDLFLLPHPLSTYLAPISGIISSYLHIYVYIIFILYLYIIVHLEENETEYHFANSRAIRSQNNVQNLMGSSQENQLTQTHTGINCYSLCFPQSRNLAEMEKN